MSTPAGRDPIDMGAILAAMQDQLDDLTATVEAHQRTLDQLLTTRPPPRGDADGDGADRPGPG